MVGERQPVGRHDDIERVADYAVLQQPVSLECVRGVGAREGGRMAGSGGVTTGLWIVGAGIREEEGCEAEENA